MALDLYTLAQQRGYDVEALMKDPAVMAAIQSSDIQSLLNDPQVMYMNPGDIERIIYNKIQEYGPVNPELDDLIEKYQEPEIRVPVSDPDFSDDLSFFESGGGGGYVTEVTSPETPEIYAPEVQITPNQAGGGVIYTPAVTSAQNGAIEPYQAGFIGGEGLTPWLVFGGLALLLLLWRD